MSLVLSISTCPCSPIQARISQKISVITKSSFVTMTATPEIRAGTPISNQSSGRIRIRTFGKIISRSSRGTSWKSLTMIDPGRNASLASSFGENLSADLNFANNSTRAYCRYRTVLLRRPNQDLTSFSPSHSPRENSRTASASVVSIANRSLSSELSVSAFSTSDSGSSV